jgi:uncharacterized protein (DUF3084 family)
MKEQNKDLSIQIEFLNRFSDEQRTKHQQEIQALSEKSNNQASEIEKLLLENKRANEDIASMRSGMQNDSKALQTQLDQFKSKLDEEKLHSDKLKEQHTQVLSEKEAIIAHK